MQFPLVINLRSVIFNSITQHWIFSVCLTWAKHQYENQELAQTFHSIFECTVDIKYLRYEPTTAQLKRKLLLFPQCSLSSLLNFPQEQLVLGSAWWNEQPALSHHKCFLEFGEGHRAEIGCFMEQELLHQPRFQLLDKAHPSEDPPGPAEPSTGDEGLGNEALQQPLCFLF